MQQRGILGDPLNLGHEQPDPHSDNCDAPRMVSNGLFERSQRTAFSAIALFTNLPFLTSSMPGACAEGVVREGHFKWWDTHKVADTAYPEEKLVPGFK